MKKSKFNFKIILSIFLVLLSVSAVTFFIFYGTNEETNYNEVEEPTSTLKMYIYTSEIDELCVIEYEEGMTWEEWVASDYNTFGVEIVEVGDVPMIKMDDLWLYTDLGDGTSMFIQAQGAPDVFGYDLVGSAKVGFVLGLF